MCIYVIVYYARVSMFVGGVVYCCARVCVCVIGGVANDTNIGICHGVLLIVMELVNDDHVAEVTRVLSE